MFSKACLLLAIGVGLASTIAHAESKPVELKWTELGPLVIGHTIEFTTKDGVTLKGDVLSVRPDALVLDAKRTSNSKLYPRGGTTVPQSSVNTIRMFRSKGKWGRGIGTTLGVFTGLSLGGASAAQTQDSVGGGIAVFLVVTGACTVAGYFIGRAADHRTTTIHIVP